MSHIHVIGSGLVGSLLSVFLSKKGQKVIAYERRPDMRKTQISAGRSINLAMSERGFRALKEVGLDSKAVALSIPMRGRMIHDRDGSTHLQPYSVDGTHAIHSISRAELNKLLMNEAENLGVEIHFNQRLLKYDTDQREITLIHEDSKEETRLRAPHLLATDGAFSHTRDSIQDFATNTQRESCTHGYKELLMPALNGIHAMEKHALHIWPRGSHMLIALPNLDGSFTCTLFLAEEGDLSFGSLQRKEDLQVLFQRDFADALALIPDLAEQFFENPTGRMLTIRTKPWYIEDKVLLLGDAAHGIVPFFGQGMNCGFEDCLALAKLWPTEIESVSQSEPKLEKVFQEFYVARKGNADAIATMALENFVEMRDKVADPHFLNLKKFEQSIQKQFPDLYRPRYELVSFSTTPYSRAYEIGLRQKKLLDSLVARYKDTADIPPQEIMALLKEYSPLI